MRVGWKMCRRLGEGWVMVGWKMCRRLDEGWVEDVQKVR